MKKTLIGSFLGLGLLLSSAANAEPVTYTVSGSDNGTPFTVEVSYDNESPNMTVSSWAGWQTIVTIPEGQIAVNYGGSTYNHTGISLWHSSSPYGSDWKVEAIQNGGLVNQVEVQIGAYDDFAGILDPYGSTGGDASMSWGFMSLYINDSSIFASPYLDPASTTFSKSMGAQQAGPCGLVGNVVTNLSNLCQPYMCPWDIEQGIAAAITDLQAACQ
jgi:hypothetical protein